jgi:hypothetical protein
MNGGLTRLLGMALAAGVLLSVPAKAQTYRLIGSGNSSCGQWSADRRDGRSSLGANMEQQWVLGFLSGIGAMAGDKRENPLNGVDAAAVWAWIDNYCQAHPLEYISGAATAFYRAHPR